MRTVAVELRLHTPARIATGRAARGLDAVLDADRIPSSSLKGLMRASAREILGLSPTAVDGVFGSPVRACAWAWNDADLTGPKVRRTVATRVRIPIDPDTGVAAAGGMFHAEELWLDSPVTFTIEQISSAADADVQADVLAAAAMAVKGLGASRRRGLGWTTMTAKIDGAPVDPHTIAETVIRLRERS